MDPNTLPYYLAASVLCAVLLLLLVGFARLYPGARVAQPTAWAMGLLVLAFGLSGIGNELPRWATVVGTNSLLLASGVVFHTGFRAQALQAPPRFDTLGWSLLALLAFPFAYWGLVEPNGQVRTALFSFAVVLINGRTAWALLKAWPRASLRLPMGFLALLFAVLTAWMALRGLMVLLGPPPADNPGANPTQWVTIFAFMVLASAIVAAVLWLEIDRISKADRTAPLVEAVADEPRQPKVTALWVAVLAFLFLSGTGLGWYHEQVAREEQARALDAATLANNAFAGHARRVIGQADSLLRAVRAYYTATGSLAATEDFIDRLELEPSVFENIYLINAQGQVVISHEAAQPHRNVADRDYFAFHSTNTTDALYFSPTDVGRITQVRYFRINRRIETADGAFAGVLLINIRPSAFTEFFQQLAPDPSTTVALVGSVDQQVRARYPDQPASMAPGATRAVVQNLEPWPLTVSTTYTEAGAKARTAARFHGVALSTLSANGVIVVLAFVLTLTLRQRSMLEHYLGVLKELHRRSGALLDATGEGVLLLDQDRPIDVNPAAVQLFGASGRVELLGLSLWSSRVVPAQQPCGTPSAAFFEQQVALATAQGTSRCNAVLQRLDNGKPFSCEIVFTAVRWRGQSLVQAVLRDTTERVAFEQQLQAANDALRARHAEQERFMAMLSHELKTPLAVVQMSLPASAPGNAAYDRVLRAVNGMETVIARCLQSDQMPQQMRAAKAQPCDLNEAVAEAVAAARDPLRVHVSGQVVASLQTDAEWVHTVLSNLIDNALKYSPSDALVDVELGQNTRNTTPGAWVRVSNPDGPGGRPDAERLFEKYYRAPAAQHITGSGLGLHIAIGAAEHLGGTLRYIPGPTTLTFELWIPY